MTQMIRRSSPKMLVRIASLAGLDSRQRGFHGTKRPAQFPRETLASRCTVSMKPKRGLSTRHDKAALFGFAYDGR
jgi:hypothetical protein